MPPAGRRWCPRHEARSPVGRPRSSRRRQDCISRQAPRARRRAVQRAARPPSRRPIGGLRCAPAKPRAFLRGGPGAGAVRAAGPGAVLAGPPRSHRGMGCRAAGLGRGAIREYRGSTEQRAWGERWRPGAMGAAPALAEWAACGGQQGEPGRGGLRLRAPRLGADMRFALPYEHLRLLQGSLDFDALL